MYFVFTVIRLILSLKWKLPRWFLLGSVIGDIGLLMVLIWSFHLQYEQPAPFYLKAPTLLYIFIFISLRTLRFESMFVVAAGSAAAVGWFALLWYAIAAIPDRPDVITRDYVHYLTSNTILIGAEIDKIISILLVTSVLALSQVRARRLLIRAVTDATAVGDLSRFVAREVADQITAADHPIQPGDGEVKTASILFCDIEGFSGIAERLAPDALMLMLNEYFSAVHAVIERHGGVITEFRGDAMLVTFNTARPDPNHPANALRTAIGIQQLVRSRRFGSGMSLPTRCGISTGEVISGAVGTKERLLFTVHGDVVNVAARLEQMNKEFGTYVLASEPTIRAAGAEFSGQPIGSVMLRGRSQPATVYAISAPPPALPSIGSP
jgi:adenylate cyclase